MLCPSATRVPLIVSNISVKSRKMSSHYLKMAEKKFSEDDYPDAYKYFILYFESLGNPQEATEAVQLTFTQVVHRIGDVLEEITDNTEKLLKVYLRAINFFPNNYSILSRLARYLFDIGEKDIARRYFDLAVSYNTKYLPANKGLLHYKWAQLPRWHFRMLNDVKRNTAYFNAIVKVLNQGYTNVTDLGAGCGLLSLIASQIPEASVTAIEESKVLSKLCENILEENARNNVKVLNMYSTELSEAPGPCNFLVTEIFDCALFGEKMLESLVHAHKTLITEENFKIVPAGARLHVSAIDYRSPQNYRFVNSIPQLLLTNICIRQLDTEPYDTEDLSKTNVTYMSESVKVFDIDFYNYEQLNQMQSDPDFSTLIEIKCIKDGELNALAVWFDLDLTDDISITTNPQKANRALCWQQAVFHFAHPLEVKCGEVIQFKVTILDGYLLRFTQISKPESCTSCWFVSKDTIAFLNDRALIKTFLDLSEQFHDPKMTLMDLNCFPIFGFMMAKQGCTFYTVVKNESLQYMDFFDHVLNINKVKGKMIVVEEKITKIIATCMLHEYLKETKVCLMDPVHNNGSLQHFALYRARLETDLSTIMLPKILNVKVMLIYSWNLDHWNRVADENVFNFKIAKHVNEYTGSEHPYLEFLDYTAFSNPVTFNLSDGRYDKCQEEITATKNGEINGIYTWFEISYHNNVVFSTLDSYYFMKTCYLCKPKSVKTGQNYRVTMEREECYIDFRFE